MDFYAARLDKPDDTTATRYALGAMSGTSIDSLDAALVRIDGVGLGVHATLVALDAEALGELAPRLRVIAEQNPVPAGEMANVSWELGLLHVRLLERLIDCARQPASHPAQPRTTDPFPDDPAVIAVHGQTVYHKPPVSWQLINPAPIAARWPRSQVIADLRQEDLALGGQGAPITPLADWILFRDATRSRAIVNLGGFCNITILPKSLENASLHDVRGFDVCACNHVLDTIARTLMHTPYDAGGSVALAGTVDERLSRELYEVLVMQLADGRSLGTGDEVIGWVRRLCSNRLPEHVAASACDAIGRAIAKSLEGHAVDQVVLAGGGALNQALFRAIKAHVSRDTIASDVLGVPVQAREAMAMAILGVLRVDGMPITLPQVTGRSKY